MGSRMPYDVLGFGAVALDELLYVDRYPNPDDKIRVELWEQQCGGLTGNALVAAARFGARCGYVGRLGTSEAARAVDAAFAHEGIDTANASRRAEDGIVRSTIIIGAEGHTRNVFSRRTGLTGAHELPIPENLIRIARVLLIDHHGGSGAVHALQVAAGAGIESVGDFERLDAACLDELIEHTRHLIIPEKFALAITGCTSASDAARAFAGPYRTVVVTSGEKGCWFVENGQKGCGHFPAFTVAVVDTAGCGDVFHGIYAAALATGSPLQERLRYAAAGAALKASRRGVQRAIPRRGEIDAFLRTQVPVPGSTD